MSESNDGEVFFLDQGVSVEDAFSFVASSLKSLLTEKALAKKILPEAIIIPDDIEASDIQSFQTLIKKKTPFYNAILLYANPDILPRCKKVSGLEEYEKKDALNYFFTDVAVYLLNANSILTGKAFIPKIIKDNYQVSFDLKEARRILTNETYTQLPAEFLLQFADSINFGKLGNRIGLSIAGHRDIQAAALANYPTLEREVLKKTVSILRTIYKSGPYMKLHPGNRDSRFTSLFGSINHVAVYLIKNFADEKSRKFIIKMRILFKDAVEGNSFTQYSKWDHHAIFKYLAEGDIDETAKYNELIELYKVEFENACKPPVAYPEVDREGTTLLVEEKKDEPENVSLTISNILGGKI